MSATQQTGQRWTAIQVFGDDNEHHGACCICCEGYCSRQDWEGVPTPPTLIQVGEYVTDKYVAVKASLVDLGEAVPLKPEIPTPPSWTIPDKRPTTSSALFVPSRARRLTVLGIGIHDGGEGKAAQHLYLDDEHIGYLMPAQKGRTLSQIADLRRMEESLAVGKGKAWELMTHLGMENIDALMLLTDVGDELRQMFGEATR